MMKKVLSVLLAGAMVISAFGMSTMADRDRGRSFRQVQRGSSGLGRL